jgi:tRNA(His) 5'-end guanylyltransferase
MGKFDELGTRMKEFYENRTKSFLPRRTYTIIRIDGKAFHTYTKGLERPFDDKLMQDMDNTASYLCKEIQGAKLAFVQSDEISILLTDFDKLNTDAWFDGNIQKIVSVSASLATAKFNELRPNKIALFDSRVFTIPSKTEVMNYLVWRQQDTVRNSISSVAQSLYSHKELNNKNTDQMQEMCFQKGVNWNDLDIKKKRGRIIEKHYTNENKTVWVSVAPPTFTKDVDYLSARIPEL